LLANIAAFEIDEEQLPNLREFGLANSIYWVNLFLLEPPLKRP
jgi:hypothetical protein